MKSLKEFINIKNKNLNESFKSYILNNVVKATDEFISINDLMLRTTVFKNPHLNMLAEALTLQVADVFRKYIDADETQFYNYLEDIFYIFSAKNINNKEDEIFNEITKEIDSLKTINNKFNDISNRHLYYKKSIINSFSSKFNDRELYDYKGNQKRNQASFELAKFTDDLFDKYSLRDIDNVKPGLSPMIITDFNDNVIGITIDHDIKFAIDPYTILKPNEKCSASLFFSALGFYSFEKNRCNFPLKIHIEFPGKDIDSEKYDKVMQSYMKFINYNIFESKTFVSRDESGKYNKLPSKHIMNLTINDVDSFLAGERSSISQSFNKYFTSVYNIVSNFIYYILDKDFTKAINPYNFTVCVDITDNILKYKDYIKKLRDYCLGNVYILNKDLYKEKRNKETGVLEPVNSQYLNFEKFAKRNDWKEFVNKNNNVALSNLKRYNEIIKNNKINNSNVYIIKELNSMMNDVKNLQKLSFKICNVLSDKIYNFVDPIFQETSAKKNYKKLNILYSKTDDENNSEYSPEYISRNSYARTHDNYIYTEYIIKNTIKNLSSSQTDIFIPIQTDIIEFLNIIFKTTKLENKILPSSNTFESLVKNIEHRCNEKKFQTHFIKTVHNIVDAWKNSSKNTKTICFNDDENLYNEFLNLLNEFENSLNDFLNKYESKNISNSLKHSYEHLETIKRLKTKELTKA